MGVPGVKNLPANAGDMTQVQSLGGEDPLQKGMATHYRILSWRIPMDRGVCGKESDTTEVTSHTQGYFYGLP